MVAVSRVATQEPAGPRVYGPHIKAARTPDALPDPCPVKTTDRWRVWPSAADDADAKGRRAARKPAIGWCLRAFLVSLFVACAACAGPVGSVPASSHSPAGSSAPNDSLPPTPVSTAATSVEPLKAFLDDSTPVRFTAMDGVQLEGRIFGEGEVAIALSHMGRGGDDQTDWFSTAAFLADEGYRVLTYNRRGVCPGEEADCSEGSDQLQDNWMDAIGAERYLRAEGASQVILGGASIGAMGSYRAAETLPDEVDGVIWIAGILRGDYVFDQPGVSVVRVLKLFISGTQDVYEAAGAARQMYEWSIEPRQLLLIESDAHGTDMLAPDADERVADELRAALIVFLDQFPGE